MSVICVIGVSETAGVSVVHWVACRLVSGSVLTTFCKCESKGCALREMRDGNSHRNL